MTIVLTFIKFDKDEYIILKESKMAATMQKISEQKIYQYGIRGIAVALPKVFAKDHSLEKGDSIDIYRTQIEGKDVLVIMPQIESESIPQLSEQETNV